MPGGPRVTRVATMLAFACRLLVLLGALAVLLAASASASAARALPDLRPSVTKPPTSVAPGETISVRVTLRNAGRRRAPATLTRVSLGAGRAYAKGDLVLGTVASKAVPAGRGVGSAPTKLRVPRTAKPGPRKLVACADVRGRVRERSERNNCVVAGALRVEPRKLGLGVARDDNASAVSVNALARRRDPDASPPAPSRGPVPFEHRCLEQVKKILPDTAGLARRTAPRSDVTFFWPKDKPERAAWAADLAAETDAVIWPKLTRLMGRTPPPDAQMDCHTAPTDGLDVFLVDDLPDASGSTRAYACLLNKPNPSFIRIDTADKHTLAHEIFHALQFAFPDQTDCVRPDWLEEGTAEWAVEFVYPKALGDVNADWLTSYPTALRTRSYDAWPFWYSVAKHAGAERIRDVYQLLADKGRITAADEGIGTFLARWPEFARDAWNDVPVESFRDWTETTMRPQIAGRLYGLDGASTRTISIDEVGDVPELTRLYRHVLVLDDDVRKISVTDVPKDPDYKLHGLLLMKDGSWKEADLTQGRSWCRDKPGEDVKEIVFIGSNASPYSPVAGAPKLKLDDRCSDARFRVVAADFSTKTTGSTQSDWGQTCDVLGVSGTEDYGGHLTAPVDDPDFRLKPAYGGALEGSVYFDVPATGTRVLKGCTKPPPKYDEVFCQTTNVKRKANGMERIGFSIDVDPAKPQVAELTWSIEEASIGYFDADDSVCNVFEFYNHVSQAQEKTEVPLAHLERGTHTFTNKDQTTWNVDAKTGRPASLGLDWDYSVTIQVVDADGDPIP
jgi:hypothetical protein